jgi:hypothetical protein
VYPSASAEQKLISQLIIVFLIGCRVYGEGGEERGDGEERKEVLE